MASHKRKRGSIEFDEQSLTKKARVDEFNIDHFMYVPSELFVKIFMQVSPNGILLFRTTSKVNEQRIDAFIRTFGRIYYARAKIPKTYNTFLMFAAAKCSLKTVRLVLETAVWQRSEVKAASNAAFDTHMENTEFLNHMLDVKYF